MRRRGGGGGFKDVARPLLIDVFCSSNCVPPQLKETLSEVAFEQPSVVETLLYHICLNIESLQ